MTTLTLQDIHWPDLDLPPINLWNAPRMKTNRIRWICNGHTITCTRNGLSASIAAPIDGWYTDAREWTRDVLTAIRIAESKLEVLEFRERV